MGLNNKNFFGVSITVDHRQKILEEIERGLESGIRNKELGIKKRTKPLIIFTPNPEIINFAQKNSDFRKTVNSAQINIPDGAGLVWAVEKLYKEKIERISGVDFMKSLCETGAKKGVTIGLIGGRDGVALEAGECLKQKYPGLKVEVLECPEIGIRNYELGIKNNESEMRNNKRIQINNIHNSYFIIHDSKGRDISPEKYFTDLVKDIERKNISILFVALGFPKQEYFIDGIRNSRLSGILDAVDAHSSQTASGQESGIRNNRPLVLMSVGGAFDYISGRIPRAPLWMRERGLEWLYRLIREPWRLPRQIRGAEFFWRVQNTSPRDCMG